MNRKSGNSAPKRQHFVSQTLLKQFSGDAGNGVDGISQIDVASGHVLDPKPSKSIGFEWNMIKHDAKRMEELWQTVEDPMRDVYSVLAAGKLEDIARYKTAVTDFIALHFARSQETKRIHLNSYETIERRTREDRAMLRRLLAHGYPELDNTLTPFALDAMAETVLGPLHSHESKGILFQEFVEPTFARTQQILSNYSLCIRPALPCARQVFETAD